MSEETAKERKEARQERAREQTREVVGKAGDFLTHIYDDVKIGGNVDQTYLDAFDWLMANQDMNLKEFSDDIDSFLIDNIDKPIGEFFESTGKKIVEQFRKDEDGRFGWEKSLVKAFKDFGASFLQRVKDKNLGPDLAAGAAEFENELDTRINNLQALINSATPDEVSELPAWQLELDTLRGRLVTMPDSGDVEELATWMAGTDAMPDGLRVTDTFSVRGEEKEILEKAIENTEAEGPRLGDVNPERLAANLKKEGEAAAKKRQGSGRTVNPADAAILGTAPESDLGSKERELLDSYGTGREEKRQQERDRASLADRMRRERDPGYQVDPNYEGELPFTGTDIEGNTDRSEDDDTGGSGGSNQTDGTTRGSELTSAAMEYISENFGSVEFFRKFHGDKMWIDTDGDGTLDTNVIDKIIIDEEENPDVIWGLFQKTQWFQENGPTARQFQMDWAKAAGSLATDWSPSFNPNAGINEQWNMNAGMKELLDDTYDGLVLEANRLGINTDKTETKNAIMQMAYNAKQLNMTEYELKNEFLINTNLAFNPTAVQGSSTFNAIKQKIKQDASVYMLKLDDTSINDFANKIYLGKTTYEGLNAMHAQKASEDNPALKSLIDQGYTPSAYFSSYGNVASNLLGRPIDFMGTDNKMFGALTNTMIGENNLGRPMTRGEFERYVRATPEWDTSENARDEAYGTVGTLLSSFGIKV